jgi:23S rRNA pseudouridine955/2504/2580 synthase
MPKLHFEDLILWENEDFLLINKPPLISTLHERTKDKTDSVISLLRLYNPDYQICHRLDKETSGILALSKHAEAYRHLSMQFERRKVEKFYHAVVEGKREFEQQIVDLPILKLSKKGLVAISKEEGKKALTTFQTLKFMGNFTLVEARPYTGRMHQIRIHLSRLKAPIVADLAYGGRLVYLSELKKKFKLKQDTEEQPLMQRVALHAYELKFKGMQDEDISGQAPYPKDFGTLVKQLEKK